jgi:hypothetical protein
MEYKRNQIEDAISRTVDVRAAGSSSELRTRVKRLLDTDRNLGRNKRSTDPTMANYAFYSSDSPGKGVEVGFSEYEGLAVMTGLRLLQHGWPQRFAVEILRRHRSELEQQHTRILKQDPKVLFDKAAIREGAQPGDLAFDNTDPVFLTIASGRQNEKEEAYGAVCRGMKEVAKFLKEVSAKSWTLLELVTPAHELHHELLKAEPRKRGRSS